MLQPGLRADRVAQRLARQRQVAQDGAEDVVEIMRNAARQRAQGLHLLRLAQGFVSAFALDHDRRQLGRFGHAGQFMLARRVHLAVVDAQGAQHLACRAQDRLGPGRCDAMGRHQRQEFSKARIGPGVGRHHPLAGECRRATAAHHRPDGHVIERLVEVLRQAGRGATLQPGARGVEQHQVGAQTGLAGLQTEHDGLQRLAQRRTGGNQAQHPLTSGVAGLGPLALGDVVLHRHPVGVAAGVVSDRHHVQLDPERLAAAGVVQQLRARRLPAAQGLADAPQFGRVSTRALQESRRPAQHFVAAVAGAALERLVDEQDARAGLILGFGLGDQHDVVEARHAAGQQLELLLDPPALGDVGDHRQRAGVLASLVVHRVGRDASPQLAAVLAAEAKIMLFGHALAAPLQVGVGQRHALRVHEVGQRPAHHLGRAVAQHLRHLGVDEAGQ